LHSEYITYTLSYEMKVEGKELNKTKQFKNLFEKYTRNLKENALAAYSDNDNFRRAILDFNTPAFNNYEDSLKSVVIRMINTLKKKFEYTVEGAKQVSVYVIDKKLDKKY